MRDRPFYLIIEQTVAVNYSVVDIREKREIETRAVFEFLDQCVCFIRRVNTNR